MAETKRAPVDAAAVLDVLAAYWRDPAPARFTNRIPGRIAGGEHDQPIPDGISNPYWEIIRQLPLDNIGMPYRTARPEPDAFFFNPRDPARLLTERGALCVTFAWSVPSPGDIAWIVSRLSGTGIVEPGAGSGYWAWQLAQAGADVVAYDPAPPDANKFTTGKPWYPVLRNDHRVVSRHPGRSLLLCWPGYGSDWAGTALAMYGGNQVFYAGEGEGGCCADDAFFRLLDAEWEDAGDCPAHVSFSGIHCYLTEYRRKAA